MLSLTQNKKKTYFKNKNVLLNKLLNNLDNLQEIDLRSEEQKRINSSLKHAMILAKSIIDISSFDEIFDLNEEWKEIKKNVLANANRTILFNTENESFLFKTKEGLYEDVNSDKNLFLPFKEKFVIFGGYPKIFNDENEVILEASKRKEESCVLEFFYFDENEALINVKKKLEVIGNSIVTNFIDDLDLS